ncbi:aldo/keto reductase [Natronomonas salina]|uniref:aldo/keto reductase n=1 Tax=Natronomonas salina TaxID=1710540 RepID=UPI0015B639A0|nr:aldo/keto reductase [Natronomonas salina]QLD88844.1 aldo/keto reductase [Natronomonas salina]
MHYRTLGASDVEVSEIGFGAWVVGTDWWGDRTAEQAREMLQYAVEQGITYFDTGDVYGHGDSEELVGEALADYRDEVTVATKIGYDFYDNPQAGHGELPKEMNRDYLEAAFEKSLDRLDMETVDVLQLHNANVDEVDADVLEFLDELREEGRVDAVGWALGPSIGWLAEGDKAIVEEFDAVQLVWNVLEQEVGDHFLETLEETGSETSLIPRVPHSSGLLNEQVTPETELGEGDHRAYRPDEWYETGWEKIEALRFLERAEPRSAEGSSGEEPRERDGERSMAQASLQWLLYHDAVATVTPTFRTREDIDEWAAASDVPALTDEEYERVQALYADDFGIEGDDGMDALRSSVEGEDIQSAGLDKECAGS